MDAFRVWMRPMLGATSITVEGLDNARWLVTRLSNAFVFKSSEPIREEAGTRHSVFHVLQSSQTSTLTVQRLLAAIPEVRLVLVPA